MSSKLPIGVATIYKVGMLAMIRNLKKYAKGFEHLLKLPGFFLYKNGTGSPFFRPACELDSKICENLFESCTQSVQALYSRAQNALRFLCTFIDDVRTSLGILVTP